MLTQKTIDAARPREKAYKLPDERGLVLLVTAGGSRLWRFRFTLNGREGMVSLGTYPEVSLKAARERREECRRRVAEGVNPAEERREARDDLQHTFEKVGLEWIGKQTWTGRSYERYEYLLNLAFLKPLKDRPVSLVTADDLRAVLRTLEGRGLGSTRHDVKEVMGRILRWADAAGYGATDVSQKLKGFLPARVRKHHAGLTDPAEVGRLLRNIDDYGGKPSMRYAQMLAPHVFLRSKELRGARWEEFDFEEMQWTVPANRMKPRRPHLVPLSPQAVGIIEELRSLELDDKLLFPNVRFNGNGSISQHGMLNALGYMGWTGEQHTIHGWRTTASTLMNEMGANRDHVEFQLSHAEKDAIRGAYNRAQWLDERRHLMNCWSNYLDALKAGDVKGGRAAFRASIQSMTSD